MVALDVRELANVRCDARSFCVSGPSVGVVAFDILEFIVERLVDAVDNGNVIVDERLTWCELVESC